MQRCAAIRRSSQACLGGSAPCRTRTNHSRWCTNWIVYDSARNTYNAADKRLYPDLSNAEGTNSIFNIDLVSNGFKIRNSGQAYNGSGDTYIYMAFAENPFKNALAR